MGGGETKIIYKTDPSLQKQLIELKKAMEIMRNELLKLKNPQEMGRQIEKIKTVYWQHLSKQKFVNSQKSIFIIFIGKTNAGKSSLFNTLWNVNQKTSKAPCTKQLKLVISNQFIDIYDCPGMDTHFDLMKQPEQIPKYLGNMDVIYYLYQGHPEEDVIKTCVAMKKKIIGVRTHCDQPEPNDYQTKLGDQFVFKKAGVVNPTIFFTSKVAPAENNRLLEHIMSHKKK